MHLLPVYFFYQALKKYLHTDFFLPTKMNITEFQFCISNFRPKKQKENKIPLTGIF